MKIFAANSTTSRRQSRQGFTLAEMLVTSTIFLVIIVAAMLSVQLYGLRVYNLATTKVKASGTVSSAGGERTSLTARLVLERYNMADRMPYGEAVDARVRAEMRKLWAILHPTARGGGAQRRVVYGAAPAAVTESGMPVVGATSLAR